MPEINDELGVEIPMPKAKPAPIWNQLNQKVPDENADWLWKKEPDNEAPVALKPRKLGEKKAKPAALRDKDADVRDKDGDDNILIGELGQGEPIFFKPYNYNVGADPYGIIMPQLTKEQEEESNLIRIDLEQAAKMLAHTNFPPVDGLSIPEDSEKFLEAYDKYYDILFKAKA